MKRVLSLVLALVMLFSLAACSGAARRARVQIVTTSFPLYDWTRNIVGDTEGVEIPEEEPAAEPAAPTSETTK